MEKSYFKIILSILSVFILFTACQNKSGKERIVSVSILPQKYFVERIAGDYLKVNVMIPPGMSPASADLNTEQLKKLYNSSVYFAVGYLPFETTHLYPVLKDKKEIELIRHSDGIELISGSCSHHHEHDGCEHHGHHHHHEGGIDPHIWVSPPHAAKMANDVLSTLIRLYPEQKEAFTKNYAALEKDILKVDEKAKEILSRKNNRIFLIYHPTLSYFAQEYQLEQVALEDDGKEPNPTQLKKIIDDVRHKNIRIIFIQNEFDVNNAQAVSEATGIKIIRINPLSEQWLDEMNELLRVLDEKL